MYTTRSGYTFGLLCCCTNHSRVRNYTASLLLIGLLMTWPSHESAAITITPTVINGCCCPVNHC
jgi:hypothetical protein